MEELDRAHFWKGAGCEDCRQLGYQGRQGIYELLLLNEHLRPLILQRAAASAISAKAIELGMKRPYDRTAGKSAAGDHDD